MRNTKSVIKGWIISYIIVLLIPIITVFVNYFYNVKVIRREIYNSNELVLNNLANDMDKILEKEKNFVEHILTFPELNTLLYHKERDGDLYYNAGKLYEKIKNYERLYEDISCIIYFSSTDYVVGTRADASDVYYKGNTSLQRHVSYEQWMELLSENRNEDFVVEKYISVNAFGDMTKESLVHVNSMRWSNSGYINIFIGTPVSVLADLTRYIGEGSNLIISIGGQPQLALSSDGIDQLPEDVDYLNRIETMYETGDNIVIRRPSLEKNVEYYMLIPKRDFWKEFQYVRNLFAISLLSTLLVGAFCVLIMVKRNYKPLSNLYNKIVTDGEKGNEFKELENAYNKLNDEKSTMYKRIVSGQEIIQNFYLLSLMKGWPIFDQMSQEVQISVKEENVILVGFLFPMSESSTDKDDLFPFVVENVFSELMEKESFYRITDGRYLYYIFYVQDETGWKEQCMKRLYELQDFLEGKLDGNFCAAVSNWEKGLKQLRKQYLSVQEALEYRSLMTGKGIDDTQMMSENEGVVNEILQYIEKHYTESDLNVNSVADGIGWNSKYASKVFKKETGRSILDYIHGLRIRRAQELIRQEKCSLEEIYTKVGYTNDATFRRAFVKITGMVPKDYKEETQ